MNLKHKIIFLILCSTCFAEFVYDDLKPNVTDTWDLGTSSLKWEDGHFNGTVDATDFTGDGSALTGIGSGTGGIINTGSTTIGADSDDNGSGVIVLQIGGVTMFEVTNAGNIDITNTITSGTWNGDEIDISDYTNLVAGTNITLAGDTLNVDDAFMVNDASDTMLGTLTSNGLTVTTGNALTFGVVQWDDGSDKIEGNILADNSVDDDALDFTSITLASFTADIATTDLTDTANVMYLDDFNTFTELQTQIADKTLVNEEDTTTIDSAWTFTSGISGNVTGDIIGDVTGNADTATLLETTRAFSISGDITASGVNFNGGGDVDLVAAFTAGAIVDADVNATAAIDADKLTDGSTNAIVTLTQETNWDTHLSSDGSDHTFIDQSVVSGASPTFGNANMSGNISVWTNDSGYLTSPEAVEDIVGAMVSGNVETLIDVTYDDSGGKLDFVVDEASIDHDALTNFTTLEHYLQSAITEVGNITTGTWNGSDIDIGSRTNLVAATNITLVNDTLHVDDPVVADLTGNVTGNADTATNVVDADFGDVVVSGGVWTVTTVSGANVPLGIGTTGDYVSNITGGTGIDSTGATTGETISHTLSFDSTEISDTTWGAGETNHVWTFDLTNTDTTLTFSPASMAFSHNFQASKIADAGGAFISSGNIRIKNDGTIGSTGTADAIQIDSSGNIVMSQNLTVTGDLTTFSSFTIDNASGTDAIINFAGTGFNTATFKFETVNNRYVFDKTFKMTGGISIQFRTIGQNISSPSAGVLELDADTRLDLEIGSDVQINLTDGKLAPTTDNDIDLGDVTHRFKDAWLGGTLTLGTGEAADVVTQWVTDGGTGIFHYDNAEQQFEFDHDITISSPMPILVLKDNNHTGDASVGFMEWRDSANTRLGFFGNSTNLNDDLLWKNESAGGHIGVQTIGGGEFRIFANTVLNSNSITGISTLIAEKVFAIEGNGTFTINSPSGIVYGTAEGTGTITVGTDSESRGAFAGGFTENGTIEALTDGSIALGVADDTSVISSSGLGSFAEGRADGEGSINSTNRGSFAQGYASGGSINATNFGAFAQGQSNNASITASGLGSFAQGSGSTGDIIASATNAVQFGSGTNNTANSLQVGSGVLLEAVGDITAQRNLAVIGISTLGTLGVTGISRLDGGLGVGIDPTSSFPFNAEASVEGQYSVRIKNTSSHANAFARTLAISDNGQISMISHSSGRTLERWGGALGDTAEIISEGVPLCIGTFTTGDDFVLGTEGITAITIDGTTQVVTIAEDVEARGSVNIQGDLSVGDHFLASGTSTLTGDVEMKAIVEITSGTIFHNGLNQTFTGSKTLADGSATGFVDIEMGANELIGGTLHYSIYVTGSGEFQSHAGSIVFVAVNKAGTVTSDIEEQYLPSDEAEIRTAGSLTDSWSITNTNGSPGKITIEVDASTTLGSPTLELVYTIIMQSENVITGL